MKKIDIWFPFYAGEYLKDTMHLNTEQHGAYCLMLMHGWQGGGYIPDDNEQLASITRLGSSKWLAYASVLLAFWHHDATNHRYYQKRLLQEFERASRVSVTKADIGRLGGLAKKQNQSKCLPNATANATANAEQLPPHLPPQSQSQDPLYKETRKRFQKPTIEEVKLECAKIGLPEIEAEKFFNFYESKGWLVGKNPMRSWKGALANWKIRWQESQGFKSTTYSGSSEPRKKSFEELWDEWRPS